MCRSFKNGKHILQGRNLFVVDQNIRSIHFALHFLGIRNEVRRNISPVELHTFYNIDSRIGTFGLFYRDNTFFLYFFHSLGNELANLAIVVGRDTSNRFDFLKIVAYFLSLSLDAFYHFGYGFVDASFQIHGVGSGSYVFKAYVYDGLCQYCCCRCSVTGIIACFRSNFFYQLSTHVLKWVFQFYFFGNCHTIFCNMRSTKLFLNNYITTLRTESDFNGICQFIDSFFQFFTSLNIEFNFFCHSSLPNKVKH